MLLCIVLQIELTSRMTRAKRIVTWIAVALVLTIAVSITVSVIQKHRQITLRGAVIREDTDPSKQTPIANADVIAITGDSSRQSTTDQTGLFTVILPKGFRRRQLVTLQFKHPGYHPLQLNEVIGDQLYIARMVPEDTSSEGPAAGLPLQVISNIRVRYVVRSTDEAEVGSAVKAFHVVNIGNIPCNNEPPCSPDKRWKAATGSLSLDAGEGNQFRNVRVSCIAGPCPFTHVEHDTVSPDRRRLTVTVRNWSDTTTFLVEAEVVHSAENDLVREAYPAIFGPSLSFSLPATAEGPSIEAELNGEAIVFPLGPDLSLRWAHCTEAKQNDQIATYRCELKPGYRFR